MSKPVQSCLEIVAAAKLEVNKLLLGGVHTNNLLEINSHFKKLESKLKFMGAVTEPVLNGNGKTKETKFPPITNFMGSPIEPSKKITLADITPKDAERKKFRADVQKLYNEIRNMSADQVMKTYAIPDHVLVLRGVAKLAGLEDFETREIDNDFIAEIQLAIEDIEEKAAKQREIDKAVGKSAQTKETSTVVLTDEAIAEDPNLQKMKAKAGDEAVTAADGKVTLKRVNK